MVNFHVDSTSNLDYSHTIDEAQEVLFLGESLKEYHMDWFYSYKEERNY